MDRQQAEARAADLLSAPEPHPWRAFFLQTTISWCVLIAILIGDVIFDYTFFNPTWDGGMASIGAPIAAAFFAVLTNLVAVILGLPLRFIPAANRWIRRKPLVAVGVAVGGFVILIVGFALGDAYSGVDELGYAYDEWEPNLAVVAVGWLLIALGVTHVWTKYMQRDLPDRNPPAGTYPIPPR